MTTRMSNAAARILAAGLALVAFGAAEAATINVTADVSVSTTWTADNVYVLTKPIYVTSGATLTIQPGTLVRGEPESAGGANDPGTLIVSRGSKIRALGTASNPIVFTDLNDDNFGANPGTPPYDNLQDVADLTGRWGGIVLLGRGYVANNTAAGPSATREVQIEGLTAPGGLGLYGNCAAAYAAPYGKICDDDDSGVIQYTSLRYGGFNVSANNEINGYTLGGVGRSTRLEYLEVYQTKDDLVEFFGGAANVKHFIGANGGDDGIDYDEGWRGKVQFAFIMQGWPSATDKTDKGAEQDGGNNPDGSQPKAIPTIYNVTYVGLGQKSGYDAKSTNTALIFRDNAGGRYYNSFFADFGGAALCIEGDANSATGNSTSGQRATTPYAADGVYYVEAPSDFELELQDNEFWCMGAGSLIPTTKTEGGTYCSSATPLYYDNGLFSNAALGNAYRPCTDPLPIRALARYDSGLATRPDGVLTIDPVPADGSALLTTDRLPPTDGFFEPAAYKGAFGPNENWARGWSTLSRLGYFPALPSTPVSVTEDVAVSTTWNRENTYVLTKPIYVKDGATLTIQAGTVVRGEAESAGGANDPGTLVITRGAKLRANGTFDAPIVFTDLFDDNVGGNPGTAPYDNLQDVADLTGRWGGIVLLGRGYVANNTAAGPSATREVQIEGLTAPGGLGLYGNCAAAYPAPYGKVCDDDDSGSIRYTSLRYGGFNVSANNEINGYTLGAVGRGTTLDFLEVYQTKDDLVEFFGGAANIKHFIGGNGGDDGIDYDEGWRGTVQYALIMQGWPSATDKTDKGAEQDGGNNPDGSLPKAIPALANVTYIGLGQKSGYDAKNTNTALIFRDNAGGRYYNSFFADFGGAALCIEGDANSATGANTSGQRATADYAADGIYYLGASSGKELELKNNEFWCMGAGSLIPTTKTEGGTYCSSATPLYYDNGLFTNPALGNNYRPCTDPLPIRALDRYNSGLATRPDGVLSFDPTPADGSVLANAAPLPVEAWQSGALEPTAYKGAFAPGSNWAAGWSTLARLNYFPVCDPGAGSSVPPLEVVGVTFRDRSTLVWPYLPNDDVSGYDTLRSNQADDFTVATCLDANGADNTAVDIASPLAGDAYFYLVRARNACAAGTLGTTSSGVLRAGVTCP